MDPVLIMITKNVLSCDIHDRLVEHLRAVLKIPTLILTEAEFVSIDLMCNKDTIEVTSIL